MARGQGQAAVPNAPPPPGALLRETSWVYWITWPPALGAPVGWTPLSLSLPRRPGRVGAWLGLSFAVSLAAPPSPRPRPGAPASAQGLARLQGLQASCLSRGLFLRGHLGFLFILKAMGGAMAPRRLRSAGSKDRRISLPFSLHPKQSLYECAPACSFQRLWTAGSTDRGETELGDTGWGRACTSFCRPGRPGAAHHHHTHIGTPPHVVQSLETSPLNPVTGTKKKFFSGKWPE